MLSPSLDEPHEDVPEPAPYNPYFLWRTFFCAVGILIGIFVMAQGLSLYTCSQDEPTPNYAHTSATVAAAVQYSIYGVFILSASIWGWRQRFATSPL
ncbi:hypothetical protein EON83_03715 [bacterium]|nr:MAG: hypothetical protein EON83_03715 [bacterium]